jgi:hypothetical protein
LLHGVLLGVLYSIAGGTHALGGCNLPSINTRTHAGRERTVRVMDGWNTAVRFVGLTELVGSGDREPA